MKSNLDCHSGVHLTVPTCNKYAIASRVGGCQGPNETMDEPEKNVSALFGYYEGVESGFINTSFVNVEM